MITHKLKLKHRDNSCPMYHTCSSLGYISENCSIKCYLDTTQQEKKDGRAKKVEELLELYKKECKMIQRYVNGNYQPMGEHLDNIKQIKLKEKELGEMK